MYHEMRKLCQHFNTGILLYVFSVQFWFNSVIALVVQIVQLIVTSESSNWGVIFFF